MIRVKDFHNYGLTPYEFLRDCLKHRNVVKVATNTVIFVNDDSSVSVRLYATEILRAYSDGRTVINSGGYETVTTKARLNAILPNRCHISQRSFAWFVYARQCDVLVSSNSDWLNMGPFVDGMTITFDGPKVRRVDNPISRYAMEKVHTLALSFVLGTNDAPSDDNVRGFVLASDHPDLGAYHLSSIVAMARDMIGAGIRPS